MPYTVKAVKGGFAIYRKDTGKRAVAKTYDNKAEAERVAWLREWHAHGGGKKG